MKVCTNRCHDFTSSQGIPVRITYGSPQWRQEKTGEEVKELQKGLEAYQNALF